jgi:hypothetical protein
MKETTDEANLIKEKLLRGCYLAQERVTQKTAEEEICGDSGVLLPAVMSASFLQGFRSKYLDLSLRGTLGT